MLMALSPTHMGLTPAMRPNVQYVSMGAPVLQQQTFLCSSSV